MQKIFLAVSLSLGLMVNAQSTEEASSSSNSERKNDIMLDPISLISVSAININYERLLNENSGVGLHAFAYLGDGYDDEDDDVFSQFSPYYRMYFGKKYASGFFVEGFGLLSDGQYTPQDENGNKLDTKKDYSAFGAGIGIGEKWTSNSGLFLEASAGLGRNFSIPEDASTTLILIGKVGISVGYRF